MTRLTPFVKKIIYVCGIVALLIPLSFIARPASHQGEGGQRDVGGRLASLRNQYDLSQAKIGEIDPASETMKLMSLGFRSVAATSLWLNAIDAQTVKDWDRFAASLNTLMKIQPNFHKVWDYQAHNLSYNTSVEFDDYEQRYSWVKKGLELLREGLTYNRRDHRFTDALGRFTGQKIGKSDEKVEFRELFRFDSDYHSSLDNVFDRDSYDAGPYGKDNWLLAYQWFNRSVAMVEQGIGGEKAPLRTKELMFYMNRPAQRRNHVISLQTEFPPEESFKFKWQAAHDEWVDYGNRELRTNQNVPVSLEGMVKTEIELQRLREELDQYAPGVRDRLVDELEGQISLTDHERQLLATDVELLSDEDKLAARLVRVRMDAANRMMDETVLDAVALDERGAAERVYVKIKDAYFRLRMIDQDRGTINYEFWKDRTDVEKTDEALDAHQDFYDARRKHRSALFDDFVAYDAETQQPVTDPSGGSAMIERGAIEEFVAGYQFWADAADTYDSLKSSALFDIMLEDARLVKEMLDALGKPWPRDFPLQQYIDANQEIANSMGLPIGPRQAPSDELDGLPRRPSLNLNGN
jgi:hypothetical protein